MYYVYILLSQKDNKFYIGYTADLRKRIRRHKEGEVAATYPRLPIKLVFYEAYLDRFDAKRRERYFKTTKGKAVLKNMLRSYLKK